MDQKSSRPSSGYGTGSSSSRSQTRHQDPFTYSDLYRAIDVLPSYEESQRSLANRISRSHGISQTSRLHPSRSSRQNSVASNEEAAWGLVDDLLKARAYTEGPSHECSQPMVERMRGLSGGLFNPATVLVPGQSRRVSPVSSPREPVFDRDVERFTRQQSRQRNHPRSELSMQSHRDSGYESDSSATLVDGAVAGPSRHRSKRSDSVSRGPARDETRTMPRPPPQAEAREYDGQRQAQHPAQTQQAPHRGTTDQPRRPTTPVLIERCWGKLRYKDNWTQEFSCDKCELMKKTKRKTLNLRHPDRPEKIMHLSQYKVRAYHASIPSDLSTADYEYARTHCLLCKVCYKELDGCETTYSSEQLVKHLQEHEVEEIKHCYY